MTLYKLFLGKISQLCNFLILPLSTCSGISVKPAQSSFSCEIQFDVFESFDHNQWFFGVGTTSF